MSSATVIPDTPLPTLDRLKATVPDDLDAKKVANAWFEAFSASAEAGDAQRLASLFVEESFWRDILALTWEFRTFIGLPRITKFFADRIQSDGIHARSFKIRDDAYFGLQRPFPDVAWISFFFDFETDSGIASGIARLVPTASGDWKAHTVFTHLENLKEYPEKIGPLRNYDSTHGKWAQERAKEVEFEGKTPTVVIVGGGQSGLDVAARLKALDIPTLVVEKNKRIGDNWRFRYEALCLHDPVWYDHMPYLPFPSTWPVYAPAKKLANWLEHYAEALELNVWTGSDVLSAKQDDSTGHWVVTVKRPDGSERVLTGVHHVVFATGLGITKGKVPDVPGLDVFKGKAIHSLQHDKALDYEGQKVAVVGACTSAHDIAQDFYEHGIDVTMVQRSSTYIMSTKNGWKVLMGGLYSEDGPPTDIADRLNASFPLFSGVEMSRRAQEAIAELDKDILAGLTKAGFKLNQGIHGTGFGLLAWSKAGGYYLDTGASQLIADGKIKLKNGAIDRLTETGIKFEDGTELPADLIVFATGLGDSKGHVQRICGEETAAKHKPLWGLTEEGEINGVWGDSGVKNLWSMLGNLALCRFHSKHIALQIKAIEEGIELKKYGSGA